VRFAGGADEGLVLDRKQLDELMGANLSKSMESTEYQVPSTEYQVLSTRKQAGFTLLELMIAVLVLTFGLLAITALFATAIGNNGRSRVDSTATMLSESVLEQISAVLARGGPSAVTDCGQPPTTWSIDTDIGGAALSGSSIDFTQTNPPAGYYMNFVVCNGGAEPGTQAVYDVRWNVSQLSTNSYLVTVAARPQNMVQGRFTFALPVTLRTYVGPQ
jgi:prepilin-type N-terminal cleavage/methylation domain-containing protein